MKIVRIMSLAVVAVLALAVAPSMASASTPGFTSPAYGSGNWGGGGGNPESELSVNWAVYECEAPVLSGSIDYPSRALVFEMGSSACPVQDPAGCELVLHAGPSGEGTADIGGDECKGIDWGPSFGSCTTVVLPQEGLDAVVTNVTVNGRPGLRISVNTNHLKYKGEGSSCSGEYENGSYHAVWTVGNSVGVSEAELAPVGLFVSNAEQPLFAAESYITGLAEGEAEGEEFELNTRELGINCEIEVSGGIPASSSSIAVHVAYSDCFHAGLFPATVHMNGCYYEFHLHKSAAPYTATKDIICSGSERIDIAVPSIGCHLRLPPQSGLEGVAIANLGTGVNRGVKLTPNIEGIKYELAGCGNPGSFSDGAEAGKLVLKGLS